MQKHPRISQWPSSDYRAYKTISETNMIRDSITKYYKENFKIHKANTVSIWKGIRYLVKLKSSSKNDKVLLMIKGLLFLIKKNL